MTETNASSDRRCTGTTAGLRRSVASGSVGTRVPRRADGRVLALALDPVRHETYWGGVLPHTGQPGRAYRQIAELGADFAAAGDLVAGLTPDADIAMVFSLPSRWVMQKFPPLSHADGTPDSRAYQGLFEPFYRGAFDADLQVRVLHERQLVSDDGNMGLAPEQLLEQCRVLVASGTYIAGDATLDWLHRYAEAGGHLILGPRTGYADLQARVRPERQPGRLSDAAGAWYDEFSNLTGDVHVRTAEGSPLTLSPEASATRWADGMTISGAQPLAVYEHAHFGRWPAITTIEHGTGRVTTVGTIPNPTLAKDLMRWAAEPRTSAWRNPSDAVTISSATARDGRRLTFVHNWSWNTEALTAPVALVDAITNKFIESGDSIPLNPWDVRVLVEAP